MVNFWVSLFFILVSWSFAVFIEGFTVQIILTSAIFFGLYFLIPILKIRWAQVICFLLPLFILWNFEMPETRGFVWLIYITLALQATSVFSRKSIFIYGIYLYFLAILPSILLKEWILISFSALMVLLIGTLYFYLYRTTQNEQTLTSENEELRDDFQRLKRQLTSGEEMVRQEERNQIAREIHDSVGHRLTALLMQVEAARIQASDENIKEKFQDIKELAQSSLYDTRAAVKTLKSEETSGIQAVIQLIRKLEAESQLRLSITMQSGVLGAVLTNQQSVAVYRAIQEALTNMMRHSNSRQAEIEFQIIAQRDFRFRISHRLRERVDVKEGFGLTNMRERLENINGRLQIEQAEGQFHVIGQFPLEVKVFD